jgi:uncharacterized RDD family membrane protein YckC
MAWYYKDGDEEVGPVEKDELQALVKSKRIDANTRVRSSTMKDWKRLVDVVRKKEKTESQKPAPAEDAPLTETVTKPIASAEIPGHTEATPESPEPDEKPRTQAETAAPLKEPAPGAPPEAVTCSQCGGSFPKNQVVTFDDQAVCAACKPAFVQKIQDGVTPKGEFRYAGFWIRVGAYIIDKLILSGVGFIVGTILGIIFGTSTMFMNPEDIVFSSKYWFFLATQQFTGIAILVSYKTYLTGRFGATVGKMACGLKVVTPSGGRVSYLRAFGRSFAEYISGLILCIGYIMVAFDSEKRSLHDRICSTRVIYKR